MARGVRNAMGTVCVVGLMCAYPALAKGATHDLATPGKVHISSSGVSGAALAGSSVANAGDVNGDGVTDQIIGAPKASPHGRPMAGSVYIVYGSKAGRSVDLQQLTPKDGYRIDGAGLGRDYLGTSVAGAGDVNGDDVPDQLIGAPGTDRDGQAELGSAYVVYGRRAGVLPVPGAGSNFVDLDPAPGPGAIDLDASVGYRVEGGLAGYELGTSVANAGDVNGDGTPDQLVGSPGGWSYEESLDPRPGAAYVIYGRRSGTGLKPPANSEHKFVIDFYTHASNYIGEDELYKIEGIVTGDRVGYSVANAGDINGDTVPDHLIGAPNTDFTEVDAGSVWVIYGRREGILLPPSHPEQYLNRINLDPQGSSVYPGDVSPFTTTSGYRIDGVASGDRTGTAVSGTGNVNADSVPDSVIGSPGSDNHARAGSGSVHIVYGRRNNVLQPPTGNLDNVLYLNPVGAPSPDSVKPFTVNDGYRLDGERTGDVLGQAVSGVGDLNGDSVADQLIGAPGTDNSSRSGSGSIYTVYGRRGGLLAPPQANLTNFIDLSSSGVVGDISENEGNRFDGQSEGDALGASVASAGDVTGDGRSDLLVGANLKSSGSGAAYVIATSGRKVSGGTGNGPNGNGQASSSNVTASSVSAPASPSSTAKCSRIFAPQAIASSSRFIRIDRGTKVRLRAVRGGGGYILRKAGRSAAFMLEVSGGLKGKGKVKKVTFLLDGKRKTVDRSAPFRLTLKDLDRLAPGRHLVKASVLRKGKKTKAVSAQLKFGLLDCQPAALSFTQRSKKRKTRTTLAVSTQSGGHFLSSVEFALPSALKLDRPKGLLGKQIGTASLLMANGKQLKLKLKLPRKLSKTTSLAKRSSLRVNFKQKPLKLSISGIPDGVVGVSARLGKTSRMKLLRNPSKCKVLRYVATLKTRSAGLLKLKKSAKCV